MKRAWIVSTPTGDFRNIFAVSEEEAKQVVFNLTYGRVPITQMWATLQYPNH